VLELLLSFKVEQLYLIKRII